MSGVTGNNKIQSRKDFKEILKFAKELIKDFPGFVSVDPTGSYNSDKKKTTFGDIDLITHIDGSLYENDKKKVKATLAKYFKVMSDEIIAPFVSDKYRGKKYYNSGEIITISLNTTNELIQAAQVDFIIALDETETKFKKDFLDMPAAKQGIVLGLVKTVLVEEKLNEVFKRMKIKTDIKIDEDIQEFEFNLSSNEIQLRLVTYIGQNTFKQLKREIIWKSKDWNDLKIMLNTFNLDSSFDELLIQAKNTLKETRSLNRMAGVFKSMISIKSGEVGKLKGNDKQKALDKVAKLFANTEGKTHGIFSGRFQPTTLAHIKIIENIASENEHVTIFLVKGKITSKDKDKNPFDSGIQKKMLEMSLPENVSIKIINTGFFVDELNKFSDTKFIAYAGSDRVKAYNSFQKYIENNNSLEIREIERDDEDISATKVRNSLKEDDEKTFKKLTDPKIHKLFEELKGIIS